MHTEYAFAKINLSLDVTGRRADGYHELVSVMQTLSLCDTLTFTRAADGISLKTNGSLACDRSNLVVRAAEAYFAATGEPFGVAITLEKRIPMQAGLGGGSADAAATLRALNAMDGERFSRAQLCEIAATIGADVPFCIMGGTQICRGVGERMTAAESRLRAFVVVAMRGEGVSTPVAFGALDAKYGDFAGMAACAEQRFCDIARAIAQGDLAALGVLAYNRFEDVINEMRPDVGVLKRTLLREGAALSLMSGSGPAVFGLFESEAQALTARDALLAVDATVFACELQ